jgi:hypothetical protein
MLALLLLLHCGYFRLERRQLLGMHDVRGQML